MAVTSDKSLMLEWLIERNSCSLSLKISIHQTGDLLVGFESADGNFFFIFFIIFYFLLQSASGRRDSVRGPRDVLQNEIIK